MGELGLRGSVARSGNMQYGAHLRATSWVTVAAAWIALIIVAHLWGLEVNETQATNILAPPLFGRLDLRLTASTGIPAAIGTGGALLLPTLAARVSWRVLLMVCWMGGVVWATGLALVDGPGAIGAPLAGSHDYLVNIDSVASLGPFLDSYAERITDYSLHAQGHPPGPILVYWLLDRLLPGATSAGVVTIVIGCSALPAACIATRALAGERTARAAAPFLVLAPFAVWIATSADTLFLGVGAWSVALMVLAATGRGTAGSLAAAGGALFGLALHLSYGLVLLAPVAFAVAFVRRRFRVVTLGFLGMTTVVVAFGLAGFWWPEGLAATLERYGAGVAGERPHSFFLVANLAAFALAIGPAVCWGLTRLRDRALWLLCGPALAAIVLADLSGLSKGEVERIWLPFAPWIGVAAASVPRPRARDMLGVQAAVAVAIQIGVQTPW